MNNLSPFFEFVLAGGDQERRDVIKKAPPKPNGFQRPPVRESIAIRRASGIAFNKHFDADGAIIFKHACGLGCEGIVSKRLGSAYRAGRVDYWLKTKNPSALAVKREAQEDWGDGRDRDPSGLKMTGVTTSDSCRPFGRVERSPDP